MKKCILKKALCIILLSALGIMGCGNIYPGKASALGQLDDSFVAKGVILMEKESGRVIYGRGEHEQTPVASTTKIMTAFLTLQQSHLDTFFEVDYDAIHVEGSSMGLMPEYKVTLRGLATGMLLHSGNDGANAAAVRIAGSTDKFVEKMNRKAAEIGMKDTHFATPSGLDYGDPYSTAYDMALLAREAISDPEFLEICSSKTRQIEVGKEPQKVTYTNSNRLLREYPGAIGVKTGFTKKAGRCLVTAAQREGVTLICVTLKAEDDWNVHKTLLDYGFSLLKAEKMDNTLDKTEINVLNGIKESVPIEAVPVTAACLQGEDRLLQKEIEMPQSIAAPVYRGQVVGEIRYKVDGKLLRTAPIIAKETSISKQMEQQQNQQESPGFWHRLFGWFKKK